MRGLPPPAPPCIGEETERCHDVTMQRVLPLCKGELEGVVGKLKAKNKKLKIKKHRPCAAGI